jgi:hypothetical protein
MLRKGIASACRLASHDRAARSSLSLSVLLLMLLMMLVLELVLLSPALLLLLRLLLSLADGSAAAVCRTVNGHVAADTRHREKMKRQRSMLRQGEIIRRGRRGTRKTSHQHQASGLHVTQRSTSLDAGARSRFYRQWCPCASSFIPTSSQQLLHHLPDLSVTLCHPPLHSALCTAPRTSIHLVPVSSASLRRPSASNLPSHTLPSSSIIHRQLQPHLELQLPSPVKSCQILPAAVLSSRDERLCPCLS